MGKLLTFEDVARHKCKNNCWILINGKVYDVSSFMEEHPGGEDLLLGATGKDAKDDFDEVGHSDAAKELMKKFYIGDVDKSTVPTTKKYTPPSQTAQKSSSQDSGLGTKMLQFLVPLLILGIAFALRFSAKKED